MFGRKIDNFFFPEKGLAKINPDLAGAEADGLCIVSGQGLGWQWQFRL
jgi:hypothetical protein